MQWSLSGLQIAVFFAKNERFFLMIVELTVTRSSLVLTRTLLRFQDTVGSG